MNTLKRLPRPDTMRGLSSIERRFLCLARLHRADYLRLLKRIKVAVRKSGHRSLLIAACLFSMLAASPASGASAPALFNEANAAQRAERHGQAILGYERARLLAPNDKAVAQNLRAAREKAGVNAPAIPAWKQPAYWLGFNGLALLGSSALLTICALGFGARYLPAMSRRIATGIVASCGVVLLAATSAIALRWTELDRAVIQTAHAVAHVAPASNAQGVFELKAGDLVTAMREYGDFVFLRTLDQRSGWVSKSEVERVIPYGG